MWMSCKLFLTYYTCVFSLSMFLFSSVYVGMSIQVWFLGKWFLTFNTHEFVRMNFKMFIQKWHLRKFLLTFVTNELIFFSWSTSFFIEQWYEKMGFSLFIQSMQFFWNTNVKDSYSKISFKMIFDNYSTCRFYLISHMLMQLSYKRMMWTFLCMSPTHFPLAFDDEHISLNVICYRVDKLGSLLVIFS